MQHGGVGGRERHYCVGVDGLKVTLECHKGHRYVEDYGKLPVHRRPGAEWLKRMLTYWGKANGGVSCPPCKQCQKQRGSR